MFLEKYPSNVGLRLIKGARSKTVVLRISPDTAEPRYSCVMSNTGTPSTGRSYLEGESQGHLTPLQTLAHDLLGRKI